MRDGLPALLVRLFRFATTLCEDETRANELVCKTCQHALRQSQEFQPGNRLDRWCFSIMVSIWQKEMCGERGHPGRDFREDEALLVSDESES